jgi:integrase
MASIDKRPNGRYLARWREYPNAPQTTRTFRRKVDAEQFLVDVQHRLLTGSYTPPSAGQVTVADFAEEWRARREATWAASTRDRYERELRLYILPGLGRWPLAALRRSHVEEWAAALPLSPASAATVHQTLMSLLAVAVADERIHRNPASRARLPKVEAAPFVPMTDDEVRRLAHATAEHVRAAVVLAAGTGLRQGEVFGLTADRVDFMRRALRVDRQLWTPRAGAPVLAPLKTKNSYRTVALSSLVIDTLAAHLAAWGTGEHDVVFHIEGRPVSRAMGGVYLRRAGKATGVTGRTWHDLRHYHASTLLSRGVSPALVAERLGHDVKTLLATYTHVIRRDEERVRTIVDEALGGSAEDWLRTEETG